MSLVKISGIGCTSLPHLDSIRPSVSLGTDTGDSIQVIKEHSIIRDWRNSRIISNRMSSGCVAW